jgi:GNAT superfamily N-acetyltransferase
MACVVLHWSDLPVIEYRQFQNTDPPLLAELWRSATDRAPLAQPMSAALIEQHVLNKPYFDAAGLWLAIESDRPLGYVHAGFGAGEDQSSISTDLGTTAMLLVRPNAPDPHAVARELLARSENYLRSRGAKVLYSPAVHPLDPFYLGLYGGSELPGVLDTDQSIQTFFRDHGYREIDRTVVFQCQVGAFRAPVDRQQMSIRRRSQIAVVNDPPTRNWWNACTLGEFERVEYQLVDRASGKQLAGATLRTLEHSPANPGVRAAGLIEVAVDPAFLRQGMATFLLSEAVKELAHQGVGLVEAQTMQRNSAAIRLYEKLGFRRVDSGAVFRKDML